MKKFLSGVLCATLVFSLALSALAISGKMTIEVDPVNVQVNGEVFQPTDVTGKEVPVFAYQGTTYAPLRALAEAYGLEVGYDAAANMATVTDPDVKTPDTTTPDTTAKADYSDWSAEDEAAYQEFKGMWEYTDSYNDNGRPTAQYNGDKDYDSLLAALKEYGEETFQRFALRALNETKLESSDGSLGFRDSNGKPLFLIREDGEVGGDMIFHNGLIP